MTPRLFRRRSRGPMFGPPLPPCGQGSWRASFLRCEKPLGHEGKHGRVVGRSVKTGRLVESTSETWEMWAR